MKPAAFYRHTTYPQGRVIGFDFLRGIAILLTLFRHTHQNSVFFQIGWIGVHLFFVLSGFLIIDILLKEYFKTCSINYLRFLGRRALKIYPLYYLLIIISTIKNWDIIFANHDKTMAFIAQLFYVQNYAGFLWYHTWSVAAEEQFYLFICVLAAATVKFYKHGFVKKIMLVCVLSIPLACYFRYSVCLPFIPVYWFPKTHMIMDSFAFGGLLAGGKYIYSKLFYRLLSLQHFLLIPIVIFLLPVFIFPLGSIQLNTFGFTSMYFSFALCIAYLISIEQYSRGKNIFAFVFVKPIAWAGIASYSIYLFHEEIKTLVDKSPLAENYKPIIFIVASILFGKMLWWLLEKPIAVFKNKYL